MTKFKLFIMLIFSVITLNQVAAQSFIEEQLQFPRVKEAHDSFAVELETKLGLCGIDLNNAEIYVRAFKLEQELEVWARKKGDVVYKPILNYKFCSSVGQLGPKRKQGDKQIPEGFYNITFFNPKSYYFLSMQVDYPNKSDSIRSTNKFLGGDIFVHGSCETIGCIPITDEKIMELYILAVYARNAGQEKIPIHIFPARLNYANFQHIVQLYKDNELTLFWTNLRQAYDFFERNGYAPGITVNEEGLYVFTDAGK